MKKTLTFECLTDQTTDIKQLRITIYCGDEQEFYCWVDHEEFDNFTCNITSREKVLKVGAGKFLGVIKDVNNCILLKFYLLGANTPAVNGNYKIDIHNSYYNQFRIDNSELYNRLEDVEFTQQKQVKVKIEG